MTSVPGLRGYLVAPSYLAREVAHVANQPHVTERHRQLESALARLHTLGPASAPRHILDALAIPVLQTLGLGGPHDVAAVGEVIAGTARPPAVSDASRGTLSPVTVVVTPWSDRLERHWRSGVIEARRRHASWCVFCNGTTLRIVDAGRLYSRRFAEFDLSVVVENTLTAASFWRMAAAAALFPDRNDPTSLHALVARSEQYAANVCRSLRDGVLAASEELLGALIAGVRRLRDGADAEPFEQALTVVYRIVFLLFAEARGLAPLWHPVYRESYSIESLRILAERSGRAPGLWDSLRAIARLAHAGCRAGDLQVTPFNGRLFAPARTPLAERRNLDDLAAQRAILALSTRTARDGAGRERIMYAELGVEQLGAVYETLLDYQPHVHRAGGPRDGPAAVKLEPGSGVRKATGTFYTPQPIAEYLVRRTIGPLVQGADPDAILRLRIVDPAMGSGAFLVAACTYIASAYEEALVACGRCHPADIDEHERTKIRRLVAERCLYGVDLNPMAVQLARLSMWLTTLAADRPLSFLDHRLVAGDSLFGAWLSSLRRRPAGARRRLKSAPLPLFDGQPATDALRHTLPVRFSLESTPSDTLDQVRAKERAFAALSSREHALSRWKRVADLWCAAWFGDGPPPIAYEAMVDHVLGGGSALPGRIAAEYLARTDAAASARRFFHWELEFPEVFFDADGRQLDRPGFDAVIGNPPWDMMRADAPDGRLTTSDRASVGAAVRFARDSGVYAAESRGHLNRYQLFVERALALTRAGGRVGLVLPSGLATDAGSASLRRLLFSRSDVDAIVGVDNRRRIFPIHRSVRFLLVTATAGGPTGRVACRFGIENTEEIHALHEPGSGFPIHITCDALERLSGPALSIPDLRHPLDLAILQIAASRFAPLGAPDGWNARFGRELNATEDSGAFREGGRGLPVVDGRHVEPFRVALDRTTKTIAPADARRLLHDPCFERSRLAYRDVAGATNRLTLIAAILPAGCVSTHTVFCLRSVLSAADRHLLCGFFNSLVVNYFVRLRVSTHVTTGIVEQLPIPTRAIGPRACRDIGSLARYLSRWPDVESLARLNARVAGLYQLTREEFEHVLSTFPLVESAVRRRALEIFVETQSHGGAQR